MQYDNNKNKKRLTMSKVFSQLILIFAIIIIIFSSVFIIQIKVLNRNYANILGYTILEVQSGSMQKEILIGDLVIVKILTNSKENNEEQIKEIIEVDDIITFTKENYLITHRVIEKKEEDLITKGDANNTEDKPIYYSDIVGKVVKIIPNIAIWKRVFSEKTVLIPLLSGVTLLVVTLLIEDDSEIKKESNEKKKQKIQKGKRFKT